LVAQGLEEPELGFGLQQAVLEEVVSRSRGPTALLWTSAPYVAATRPETRLPGFGEAVRLAEGMGYPVLVRNSGGGAVAANEGALSFSLTAPVEEMRSGLYERYDVLAGLIVSSLERLGVRAEPGEVTGEFCPGAYSVRTGGPEGTKVAGLAQRVTRRAARVEALVLVERTAELRPVLSAFYGALGLPFRPESVGDLPVGVDEVIQALSAVVAERYGAEEGRVDGDLLAAAREKSGLWRVPAGERSGGAV
jgi:lipoate-protein ligase A